MNDGDLICLSYDPETGRAAPSRDGAGDMGGVALGMRDRYLAAAESVMLGSSAMLHVAFDEALVSRDGHSGRRVMLAAEAHDLARVVGEIGTDVGRLDAVVVMGPEFIGWDGDERRMREVVAGDLAFMLERLYPVTGEGPIKPLLPWLVRLAGSVLIQGAQMLDDGEVRAQRAIGRTMRSAAAEFYDSWNAEGQMATDYPAFAYLSEEVAGEALRSARTLVKPVSLDATARMVHEAVGRAMVNLGVRIEARPQ